MIDVLPIRRALVSVADKAGLIPFAQALLRHGVEIVSSGATAALLVDAGVHAVPVADVTGFPEMLGGRVKTLHPRVHAGILADKDKPEHLRQLAEQGIAPFDLVVANLYPFREAVRAGARPEEVIEQIDVGGPAMVRAAAKNFGSVAVVVSPQRYLAIAEEIRDQGGLSRETRAALAREAFAHTAAYDAAIASWFGREGEGLPATIGAAYLKLGDLRYGENPHQRGALYRLEDGPGPLGGAEVLQGKEMSFNNWLDSEAAWALARTLRGPAAAIVKHHNPCGAAEAADLASAYRAALASDPVSAYGGVVAFAGPPGGAAAAAMAGVFTEVVVAPDFTPEALAAFVDRPNLRVVRVPVHEPAELELRPIDGGALVQEADRVEEGREEMKVVSTRAPTEAEWTDLLFAWRVAARVKSNAIVLAAGRATVGIGAGQMSRVDSVDLARAKAGERAAGSAMASDAFFPFRDGIDHAAAAGVAAGGARHGDGPLRSPPLPPLNTP